MGHPCPAAAAFRRRPVPSMAEGPESAIARGFVSVGYPAGADAGRGTLEARRTSTRLRRRRTAPDQRVEVEVEVEVARPGQRPCLDPDLVKAAIPQVRGRHPAPDEGARTAGLLRWRLTLPIMRASVGVWLRPVSFRGEAAR